MAKPIEGLGTNLMMTGNNPIILKFNKILSLQWRCFSWIGTIRK